MRLFYLWVSLCNQTTCVAWGKVNWVWIYFCRNLKYFVTCLLPLKLKLGLSCGWHFYKTVSSLCLFSSSSLAAREAVKVCFSWFHSQDFFHNHHEKKQVQRTWLEASMQRKKSVWTGAKTLRSMADSCSVFSDWALRDPVTAPTMGPQITPSPTLNVGRTDCLRGKRQRKKVQTMTIKRRVGESGHRFWSS